MLQLLADFCRTLLLAGCFLQVFLGVDRASSSVNSPLLSLSTHVKTSSSQPFRFNVPRLRHKFGPTPLRQHLCLWIRHSIVNIEDFSELGDVYSERCGSQSSRRAGSRSQGFLLSINAWNEEIFGNSQEVPDRRGGIVVGQMDQIGIVVCTKSRGAWWSRLRQPIFSPRRPSSI